MLGTKLEPADVVTMMTWEEMKLTLILFEWQKVRQRVQWDERGLTFWAVLFAACVLGLVKVIFTGDMCGGRELAMLCIRLVIFGLPLTGTVMLFAAGAVTLGTSLSSTGEEPDEFVRRRLRGFSSSSEQLTPEKKN